MTCDMSHVQCWCCWSQHAPGCFASQSTMLKPETQARLLLGFFTSLAFVPAFSSGSILSPKNDAHISAKMFIINTEPSAKDMRRARAKNDALFDRSRRITVSVVPHIGLAEMPFEPRWVTFQTSIRTTIREVLSEINRQLPKVEHPFDITTSGPNPQRLDDGTESDVMNLLDPFESNSLVLRLRIYDPARIESTAKQSIGSRLLNALGRSKEPSRDAQAGGQTAHPGSSTNRPASCSSEQSAPPPYEAIVSR